jgi:hypothetical protein
LFSLYDQACVSLESSFENGVPCPVVPAYQTGENVEGLVSQRQFGMESVSYICDLPGDLLQPKLSKKLLAEGLQVRGGDLHCWLEHRTK